MQFFINITNLKLFMFSYLKIFFEIRLHTEISFIALTTTGKLTF